MESKGGEMMNDEIMASVTVGGGGAVTSKVAA